MGAWCFIESVFTFADERYARSELSEEGHSMAKGDPFIVWNGSTREIVISTPEHARDFYHGDGKGEPGLLE